MQYTVNYNLKKPEGTDIVNIDDLNENADIIDQKLKELENGVYNAPPNSVDDLAIGTRTPDQTQVPTSPGSGTLSQILSWLANRIKAITGKTNWWDNPPTTLQAAKNHIDAAAPHSGHETPSGAQAKADAALNSAKQYTDQEVAEVSQALDAHASDGTQHAKTVRFVVGTSTAGWTENDVDYLCDGTNDQEEIRQALNALPATGGEVVILDGIYNITATISISKDNVSIRGSGNATVLKRMWDSSSPQGVITLNSVKGCRVENLQIDGNKAMYTASNNNGIHLYSSNNNTIIGNTCNNNSSYGIRLYSSSNNMITGNTCNNNNYGIYLSSISNNNTITGNTYSNNDYGIYLSTSRNNMIIGNTCIRGTGTPEDYATDQHTILLSGTGNHYNFISLNNCMGKAPVVEGGTGNTVFNNKWDASDDIQNIRVDFDNHANSNSAHSATATPTASRIAMYDSSGRLSSGAAPTSDNHVVRKIDMEAAKKHGLIYLGESSEYNGNMNAIAVDDDYIYIGVYVTGGITNKVYKLYKSNLSLERVSFDYSPNYGGVIYAIAVDDNYIYVGGQNGNNSVYKINKSNFAKITEGTNNDWYGGTIYALAIDDNYVYIGGATTRKVYKLNKSNLSKVAESADYGGTIRALAVDDNYVYIGGETTNKVYKLNKSNLSKVAESDSHGGTIFAIAVDDDYVYIGGTGTDKVRKLNKSNLSEVARSVDYGGTIYALAIDDNYVYIGGATTNKVYKLYKSNLTKATESDSYGGTINAIAIDDNCVYIGGSEINRVHKLLNLVSLKN